MTNATPIQIYADLVQSQGDLVTLLDACDMACDMLPYNYEPSVRAIVECHDLGHALTGGDALRKPWAGLRHMAEIATAEDHVSAPDICRRVIELLDREVARG